MHADIRAKLASVSDELKFALRALAATPEYVDLAFIGNTSDHYPSSFGFMVDFDAFLFVSRMDAAAGMRLAALREHFERRAEAAGIDFELRIVEGPYKPAVVRLERPAFVAHLGVFTETLYAASPALRRWGWRKYLCERERTRLLRLAPDPPGIAEFLSGRKGLRERRAAIEAGRVEMTEWTLPELTPVAFAVDASQPNFVECCFAYAANCARNHARVLSLLEADRLENSRFFRWYDQTVFASAELLELMAHKARCRDRGFDLPVERARELALIYMRALDGRLSSVV